MNAQDYQIAAFFGLVILFEVLERVRPAREVDRWKDVKIDVLSFSLAILLNRASHFMVGKTAQAFAPHFVLDSVARLQALASGTKIVLAVLLVDLIIYWIHRAQHRFETLWRTHAWHHSIEQLYWFSGFRTSFFHSFLYAIPAASVPILLFNLTPLEAGIGYSFGLFVQFWEHTNLNVKIGPLAWIFITPDYHRVHHSTEHSRSNFGTTFSFWDRMFGTYIDPDTVPASAPLGLGEPVQPKQIPRMLVGV
jgi:sterol desaturase/sphingolipid hydroxylase (fatty acid hydroxylase superfamily)